MNEPVDFHKVRRVLVAKLRHHGDVLLSSPVFSVLKERYPQLESDAYIYAETLPMLEGHPAISKFLLYDKGWKRLSLIRKLLKELALLWKIRKGGYDLVINLTEGDRGAIAAGASKARWKIGFDPEGGGMKGKEGVYTHLIKHTPKPRHTVEKQLDALRCLGIFPTPEEREVFFHIPEEAYSALATHGLQAGEYIQIHPVSRWMFKSLQVSQFARLIELLHAEGEKIVLTASSDPIEREMVEDICAALPHVPLVNLAGKTSLKELGAVVNSAKLLISVDSVPVHLSSALKTPVVALFGPTCEQNWGPWQNPKSRVVKMDVSCRPCYRSGCAGSGRSDCLERLSARAIFDAAMELVSVLQIR